MKGYVFEEGDLELLALGILPEERREAVFSKIKNNEALKLEYIDVQKTLFNLSLENAITPSSHLKAKIKSKIFIKGEKSTFYKIYKKTWFKLAASVLLVSSIVANLYLLKEDNKPNMLSFEDEKEVWNENLLAELPFSKSIFEEMFEFLENDLMAKPCQMDFRSTKAFFIVKGINTPENLEFLKKHSGHCDCEVLMNVSQLFEDDYFHGQMVPKSHRSADIKLSYFKTSLNGPLLAFNAVNAHISF